MKTIAIVLSSLLIQPVFAKSPVYVDSIPLERMEVPKQRKIKLAKPLPQPKSLHITKKVETHHTGRVVQPKASGSLGQWLYTLRMCESGGNYKINTGNGYYGAYQFSAATWNHWKTGYARADLAPPSVQDATIIKNTKASSGGLATQNPGCYKKHGLSQFPPG